MRQQGAGTVGDEIILITSSGDRLLQFLQVEFTDHHAATGE